MENFVWRSRARVVAYLELGLLALRAMLVFWRIVVAVIGTTLVAIDEKVLIMNDLFMEFRQEGLWGTWGIIVLITLTIGLQRWATMKLLQATKYKRNLYKALEKACSWRNVTFAFFVIERTYHC